MSKEPPKKKSWVDEVIARIAREERDAANEASQRIAREAHDTLLAARRAEPGLMPAKPPAKLPQQERRELARQRKVLVKEIKERCPSFRHQEFAKFVGATDSQFKEWLHGRSSRNDAHIRHELERWAAAHEQPAKIPKR